MDPILISILVFLGVVSLGVAALFMSEDFGKSKLEDRLETLTGHKANQQDDEEHKILKREMLREGARGFSALMRRFSSGFLNLPLFFEQANSPIGIELFALISLACGGVGVVAGIIAQAPPPMYPVCFLATGFLPLMWLSFRRKSRLSRFGKQLPDALELVARALRSGHSLASGLQVVVQEMPDPVSREFGIAYEEQNLGIPIEQALKNVFRRVPNLDFKFFATAVAIQRQSGGDLAEILDKIGHIIRERFRIMGQVQALTGEGRISGIVLMALPIVLFFVMYYLNPEYMMLLFTEELGRKMIAGAVVMQILGAICIKKIIEIKI